MLKEGRCAGPFGSTQASLTGFTGIGREGRGAGRVVDAQVVLVPVATVRLQPSFLYTCISALRGSMAGLRTGMGPMKKRRDVMWRWSGVACRCENQLAMSSPERKQASPGAVQCTTRPTERRYQGHCAMSAGVVRASEPSLTCGRVACSCLATDVSRYYIKRATAQTWSGKNKTRTKCRGGAAPACMGEGTSRAV